jgi:hypothetical protein
MRDAFFFYGTLMDPGLLSKVLGRRVWPRALAPARLRGYQRRSVRGADYPVVVRQHGAAVAGVILVGVTAAERARLSEYEGEGYELVRARAGPPGRPARPVLLFRPKPGAYTVTLRPWSLASWRLRRRRAG